MLTLRYFLLASSTLLMTCATVLTADVYARDNLQKRSTRLQQLQQLQRGFPGGRGGSSSSSPGSRSDRFPQLSNWTMYIPEPPTEDEVDCHVEVEVVRLVGGRCVRLFGERRMAVCQSGMYLDVHNDECNNLLTSRESAQAQGQTSPTGARSRRQTSRRSGSQQVQENNDFRSQD